MHTLETPLPLYESVPAGLPFTPESTPTGTLDITKHLIEHPLSSYLVRVKGMSMRDAGILSGDIVIVDRSRSPRDGDIVIASLEGEVTLKTFERHTGVIHLVPANSDYETIIVDRECEILGVVVGSFRKYN